MLDLPTVCRINLTVNCKGVGGCKVVHKQASYLTRCARIAALIGLNDELLINQSVSSICSYGAARAAINCILINRMFKT